jgi:hypothetical protein
MPPLLDEAQEIPMAAAETDSSEAVLFFAEVADPD